MNKHFRAQSVFALFFVLLIFGVFFTPYAKDLLPKHTGSRIPAGYTCSAADLYGRELSAYGCDTNKTSQPGDADFSFAQAGRNPIRLVAAAYKSALKHFDNLKIRIGTQYGASYALNVPFLLTKKQFDKTMGMNMTTSFAGTANDTASWEDVVVQTEDGQLTFLLDDMDDGTAIENVVSLGKAVQAQGRNFLFCLTPEKSAAIDPQYRGVYQNYAQEKEDDFLRAMAENRLDCLDFREVVRQYGATSADAFFRTDHHWLPQTALLANQFLVQTLNERFGYALDGSIFDLSHYDVQYTTYDYLGSQGRKVTEVYAGLDEFPMLRPKYDSDLDVFIPNYGKAHGKIEEVLLDNAVIDRSGKYAEKNAYNFTPYVYYGFGDLGLIQIRNNQNHDGSRILMLKSSFARPMYCFLPNVVEYLDVIDTRYFTGSVTEYIEKTDPQTVLLICGVGMLADDLDEEAGAPRFFVFD